MPDRISELEGRLAALAEAHRELERRLARLERGAAAPAAPRARPASAAAIPAPDLAREAAAATRYLALAGRTSLALAGAFLLRALTEAGSIPAWAGAGLGLAYAGTWLALAWRAGGAEPWSATFHGGAALLIACPLLFEVTARLHLLAPAAGAAALAVFTAAALGVAARRRAPALAWLAEAGGVATAVALMLATGRLAPPALYLTLLGVAALWLGYVLGWTRLRWPVALVTDAAVALLALRAVAPAAAEGPRAALLVQAALTALYLGSIAVRTLHLQRPVVDFEVVQTALLLAVGVGGAAWVTAAAKLGEGVVGALSAAFGAAVYAVAFAFVERRQRGRANFYFYAWSGLVFLLAGTGQLLSGGALAAGWAALALLASALARATRRLTLAVHGCVFALAACLQAGALPHAATTLLASPAARWPGAPPALALVVAAMALSAWLTGSAAAAPLAPRQRAPRAVLLAALAASAAGLAVGWLVPLLAGAPGPGVNAPLAAALRTAVLVGGVLLLAWAGRLEPWREAGWLAYPLLGLVGLKLLLENLARGRPASLFVDLALFGVALILSPRLRRPAPPARAAPSAAGGPS
ncbi:hypothetical protein [Anaeromyxobacter diazotrophicus]|uniref:DUF2339 domain-containing protein n=1 Tax=Anaeromyxobacter diazotrophicus TaxID=2590199 RepID=A0A7I9VKC2_9BACT|nr:hypothetical protein [Anaeromyxobacter diazotrophicus]GEJ56852.1 hypothetical protein AMYX_15930 [Anaeromyxobacter diazotrophicus]